MSLEVPVSLRASVSDVCARPTTGGVSVASVAPIRGAPSSGVSPPRTLRVALLGCGGVGRAFAELIAARRESVACVHGVTVELVAALVRDTAKPRSAALEGTRITDDPAEIAAARPDVVVEVLPGAEPAGELVAGLLSRGIPVVTANKALLAERGAELRDLARRSGAALRFEASVAAGVPLFSVLERSLRTTDVASVTAILNGTSNFVLDRLARPGATIASALDEARRLGLAEPDATADLSGADAARKLRVLALALTGRELRASRVEVEGIASIRPEDVARAAALGFRVKQIAEVRLAGPEPRGFVAPVAVHDDHPLARVVGADNGVLLEADTPASPVGALFLSGPGAGPAPTAASLLDDVLAVALDAPRAWREQSARDAGTTPASAADDPRWLLAIAPAPRGPDLDRVIDFLAKAGLAFRTLREVDDVHGPADGAALVGVTAPAPAERVARLTVSLRTVGAVRDVRALRILAARR